jgi:hypothetical protein
LKLDPRHHERDNGDTMRNKREGSAASLRSQAVSGRVPATFALGALAILGGLVIAGAPVALADEGMWTFDNFPKKTVSEKYGFDVTDKWLEQVRLSAVRLAGGCSGSFVSADGLVMTNNHCVSDCTEEHSTAKKNYATSGFYASSRDDEAKCSDFEVNQLIAIEDVTAKVEAAGKGLSDQERNKAQKEEMSRIEKACAGADQFRCDVVSLYHGGLYHLYKYRPYRDVRLVFAPENQVAFFGGDPDNFMFPRYDLDSAFLRVYENGKPARTENHLSWNPLGPKEGDLVFVPGNPGGTDRLLTLSQLEYQREVSYPRRLLRASELRGLLTQFAKIGPEQKRISADRLMGIENSIKANRGEYEAILDKDLFEMKERAEEKLRAEIAKDPARKEKYGAAWDEIARVQGIKKQLSWPYTMIEASSGFGSEQYQIARILVRAAEELPKPSEKRLREYRDSALPSLKQRLFSPSPIYPEMEQLSLEFSLTKLREALGPDDPFVKKILGKESPENLARSLLAGTKLADVEVRKKLWEGGASAVEKSGDPMIKLARLVDPDARAVRKRYEDEVEAIEKKNSELIARAIFEVQGTNAYPDATFTPRLTYGTVKGWEENGRKVEPFTTFGGLYDRTTGKAPFDLPERWIDVRKKVNLDTPLNFSNDCDIIGGNSGSPVVGRNGTIVGLVFDGNIHSLGGNYWFDPSLNRAVAVHSAAILEALRNVYDADRLVKELTSGGPTGF